MIYVATTTGASRFAILLDKDHPEVAMRMRAYKGHSGRGADLILSTTRLSTSASQSTSAAWEYVCTAHLSKPSRRYGLSSLEQVD